MVSRASSDPTYVSEDKTDLEFFSSGCCVLDCVLSGGWPLGRISNIVGDKSTGKTMLSLEACANFAKTYPGGKIYYRESEAAFDEDYAANLGMPVNKVNFVDGKDFNTVEDFFEDIKEVLDKLNGAPALYILDSLDALSDREELGRDIDQGTYGTNKARKLSESFRRLIRDVKQNRMHLMVISQIRDKIGVTFGTKYARTGGKSLDFYATHVIYLAHVETLTRTHKKMKRAYGVSVKAKCTKNKVGLPFRDCQFDILFGMGVDDLLASLEFLKEANAIDEVLKGQDLKSFISDMNKLSVKEFDERMEQIHKVVKNVWTEIDEAFLPPRKKYEWS